MDYKKIQMTEIHFLVRNGYSYHEVLQMPIFLRRTYIDHILSLQSPDGWGTET